MTRKEPGRDLRGLSRQQLVRLASEEAVPGRYRMSKGELIEALLLARVHQSLLESPAAIEHLRKTELSRLCERLGIRMERRPTRSRLLETLRAWAAAASRRERADLPARYGETLVILLPIDPWLVHAYWEVSAQDVEESRDELGDAAGRARPVLRFYDVTVDPSARTDQPDHFDVPIELDAGNWYVHLWSPGRSYIADLALMAEDGRFRPLARSNPAETPPVSPSEQRDEHFLRIEGDYERVEKVLRTGPAAGMSPRPEPAGPAEAPGPADEPIAAEPSSAWSGAPPEGPPAEGAAARGRRPTAAAPAVPVAGAGNEPAPLRPQRAQASASRAGPDLEPGRTARQRPHLVHPGDPPSDLTDRSERMFTWKSSSSGAAD
ncbi:MAG: DUF4912 domain-containing protein [bacterium]